MLTGLASTMCVTINAGLVNWLILRQRQSGRRRRGIFLPWALGVSLDIATTIASAHNSVTRHTSWFCQSSFNTICQDLSWGGFSTFEAFSADVLDHIHGQCSTQRRGHILGVGIFMGITHDITKTCNDLKSAFCTHKD